MAGTLDTRAKHLFGEALDLTGPQREMLLDAACGDDDGLRARVEALLAASARDDRFLSATAGADFDKAAVPGERPGDTLGPYRLEELLGEGGFGTVFLAQQERPVRRAVALKIIKLGMDTRAVIARFEQERQALALMDHPNIARVIDAGVTGAGRPYFVMDLVRGEPITSYAERRKLPIGERLGLFLQVCEAIGHAHTKGVIHRDIKPSNILVSETGDPARALVRVIDFGIAKATAETTADRPLQTAALQPMGTPVYMSPEQAEGSRDIDTRTDVYSLGVLLYELLTGVTPFDSETLRAASFAELQRLIRETEPPTPSTRVSRMGAGASGAGSTRLSSSLRGDLDWIVMRALEKDRARRYDSPARLADDLRRHLEGKTVSAAPPSRAYRASKFVRRHRVAVGASALVAAALMAGTTGTTIGLFKARAARADALGEAVIAARNARVAESANTLMTSTIERANRAKENGRADITVREVMDAAAKELLEHPGAHEAEVELALARTIGDIDRELSLHAAAEAMRRLAVERAATAFGEESVEHGDALARLAATLRARARNDEADALYRRARGIFTRLGPAGAMQLANLAIDESILDMDLTRYDRAEEELKDAIAWFEANGRSRSMEYFTALHNLAGVHYRRGEAPKAVPILQRTLAGEREYFGEAHPQTRETLEALSAAQFMAGDPNVEGTIREQLASERKLRGGDHEAVANLLNSLGIVVGRANKPAEAEEAFRESVAMSRRLLGPEHPDTLVRIGAHARTLMVLGRDSEAESELREMLPLISRAPAGGTSRNQGPTASDTLLAYYNLALVMERRGGFAEAEALLRPALQAADAGVKDGDRYEWLRRCLASLLGAVIVDQASDESAPREQRLARITEAEELAVPAAERLLVIAGTIGPYNRSVMVPPALERVVRLYTAANGIDPGPEYAKALADWQARQKGFTVSDTAAVPPRRSQ